MGTLPDACVALFSAEQADFDGVRMHDKFRIMMLAVAVIFGLLVGILRLIEALIYKEGLCLFW